MADSVFPTNLCPDWVFASGSNAHACKDRGWFIDYVPFRSRIESLTGDGLNVIGVGTVALPVVKSPDIRRPERNTTLVLENVLHIPDGFCNVIGGNVPL
ncbi:hypothetical protein CI238_12938 [Colletotrichum incanum]|uniref:Retrovirus-related Pol polyprotein from transposon TNT 1-94-like beta-barrel domain-containing protein n=1 Tax=Colletotrichum incanum TaxID=1573173 RepID=A0A166UZH0_COLIC|nr:hypothetical protein CI238_12938 [Colletotrichum incanum]